MPEAWEKLGTVSGKKILARAKPMTLSGGSFFLLREGNGVALPWFPCDMA
jgi:hypothetical protein